MRLEINPGMSESQDRNLAGFDSVTPSPIEAAARAAYAANPIPEMPLSRISTSPAACCSPTAR